MADPFAELSAPVAAEADPFAELSAPVKAAPTADPFAQLSKPASDIGYTETAARGALQGVSLGNADELLATFETLRAKANGHTGPFSKLYKEYRDTYRNMDEQARAANPKTYLASELVSGVATPGIGWLKGGKTAMAAVKAGAAGGAIAGFGNAKETDAQALKEAAVGGAIGAGAGLVLHGVIKGAQAMYKSNMAPKNLTRDLHELTPAAFKHLDTIPDEIDVAVKGDDPMFVQFMLDRGNVNKDIIPDTLDTALSKVEAKRQGAVQKIADNAEIPAGSKAAALSKIENTAKKATTNALDRKFEFDKAIGQFSPAKQKEIYDEYRMFSAYTKAAREQTPEKLAQLGIFEKEPISGGLWSQLRPVNANAQRVDNMYNSDFTGAILDHIKAENMLSYGVKDHLDNITKIRSSMVDDMNTHNKTYLEKPYKTLEDYSRKMYDNIIKGKYGKDSVESKIVKFFADAKDELNTKYGLNIQEFQPYGKQKVYLPRTMMDLDSMRLKMDKFTDDYAKGTLDRETGKHYLDALRFLGDKYGQKLDENSSIATIKNFIENKMVMSGDGQQTINQAQAGAAFGRDHEIPGFLVERDLPKLMANYIHSNMKAALYQVPAARLSAQIEALKLMGSPKTAKYFEELQSQMLGAPSATKAKMQARAMQWRLAGQRTLNNTNTPFGKLQGFLQKTAPDFLGWSMGNMYPNVLALNPYSVIRNLTQPIMSGSTDIAAIAGKPYAGKITALAYKDAAADIAKGMFKKGGFNPSANGLSGVMAQDSPAIKSLAEGLRQSGVPNWIVSSVHGYDKMAQVLMKIYSAADDANRLVTAKMADRVVVDLAKGNTRAQRLLVDLPSGVRTRIEDALSKNNIEAAKEQLRNFYNVKHQYSYTQADMSQFGREYGNLLTAFTKFPLSIASDVEHQMYSKGLKGIAPLTHKYLFPLAALMGADAATKDWREDMSPALKLFSGGDFTSLSPILGIGIGAPPLIKTAASIGKTGLNLTKELPNLEMEEYPAAMAKAGLDVGKAASLFLPGIGMGVATKARLERAGILDKPED
jgi:hypothetical protein